MLSIWQEDIQFLDAWIKCRVIVIWFVVSGIYEILSDFNLFYVQSHGRNFEVIQKYFLTWTVWFSKAISS